MELNGEEYTVVQLKNWLKSLNLKTSGNKAELLLRLNEVPVEERGNPPPLSDTDCSILNIAVESEEMASDETDCEETEKPSKEKKRIDKTSNLRDREIELLKREKALLQRENELLQQNMEATILRLSSNTPNLNAKQLPIALLKEMVPPYSSDSNFEFWATQVKNVRDSYTIDENCMRAWFHTNVNFAVMSVDMLLEQMSDTFGSKENKLILRRRFENRKWKVGESFSEYYSAKITLSLGIKIDNGEMVDYLIEGIPDENLRTQACLQCFETKSQLLQAFSKVTLKETKRDSQTTSQRTGAIRCYNCNLLGHYASECRKSKREYGSCFGCGSKSHLIATCPERVKQIGFVEENEYVRKFSYSFDYHCNFLTSLDTLIDSGSPISFIRRRSLPAFNDTRVIKNDHEIENYFGLNKTQLICYGKIECYVIYKNIKVKLNLMIVADKTMSFDVVLGRDFLRQSNSKLHLGFKCLNNCCNSNNNIDIESSENDKSVLGTNDENIFDKEKRIQNTNDCKIQIENNAEKENCAKDKYYLQKVCETNNDKNCSDVDCANNKKFFENHNLEFEKRLMMIENINESKNEIIIGNEISFSDKKQFYDIFDKFYTKPQRPDEPLVKHEMKLTLNNTKPFYCPPRRISYAEREQLQKILDEYLAKKYIRPSDSEYASPIVLVKKKTGELRMCVDFRTLNKSTLRDNYPLPLIDDLLDRLADKKIFTKLDLKNGFFHVAMESESVKYTSFVTPLGQFEFLVLPFGLKNGPAVYQRYINKIFADMIRDYKLIIYLDDIMIASESYNEHINTLKEVFSRLVANKLELRLDKCEFLRYEVKYLGYIVNNEGIRADEKGLEAIKHFPIPKKVQEVQSFIGLCSYFRRFVKNFSILAKPLYDLTKKNEKFKFGNQELECFNMLKNMLLEAPVLAIFNPKDETQLHCDASALGFGAILLQKKSDDKFHPIFYFSKRTTPQEAKYHSIELETLAIIYALKRFRIYLQGREFKIITDCDSLALTLKKKELNPKIARWALELQNYDYVLEHREGQRMQHVDALSRCTNILIVESNTLEENLIICQNKDAKIKSLRESLEKSENNLYEMRNGVIYRKKGDKVLFFVPENMEQQIIRKYHDEMGHIGTGKVVELITKSYWFPNVKDKVLNYIANCIRCIVYSSKQGTEGVLHNIPKGNTPFEVIHIDHFGPIDNAIKIKKYIFLVVDAFTKFVRLYCTKTTNTQEVINALSYYFRDYSRPNTIISDRGSCFTSNDFKTFLESNDIKHIKVATGSPQANGQVERINRCIGPMLAKLVDSADDKNWTKMVETVEFTLNNSIHRAVNQHPSILLFGINQRGKVIDSLKEKLLEINSNKVQANFEQVRKEAELKQLQIQEYNKKHTDANRKEARNYEVGDYVMLRNFDSHPGAPRKLIPKFKGPYEIRKILRNDRYVISDVDNFQQSQIPYSGVWAVHNLKPWSNPENKL